MRFFPITLLALLSMSLPVWAQGDTPSLGWARGSAQTLLYGAAPVVLALLAIAGWRVWATWTRPPAERPASLLVYGKTPIAWAVLLLVAGLGFTAYLVRTTQQTMHTEEWARFERETDRVEADIQAQFENLLPALRGIRGMVVSTQALSSTEFRDWVASRDVDQEFPGISGFGLVQRFQPPGAPAQYVVTSIEPLKPNRSTLGVDWATHPVARAAAERAMQSGRPALSAGMVVEREGEKRAEALYFLPIYDSVKVPPTAQQREQNLWGWSFAPVVLGDLLAHTVGLARGQVDFQLFDGLENAANPLLFDSVLSLADPVAQKDMERRPQALFSTERSILVSGQFFRLQVHTTGDFEHAINLKAPLRLALAGSSLAVFASLTIWLLLVGRARAERLAQGMTHELQRLAMVAQHTSNAVVITDLQRRITWVNAGFTRISGYSFDEALGQHPRALLHSEKTSLETVQTIREDLRQGHASRHVISNRHKDGHDYWLEMEIQPLREPSGQLIGYMAIESDVTNMVQAREALAQAKVRADNILIGTNVGTWEWNAQTQEYVVNERFTAMLGYAPADVQDGIYAFWVDHVHPTDLVRANLKMQEMLRGETALYACDMRVRGKDGSWIWVLSRGRVMTYTADGRAEWVAGIHTDITVEKRNEEKLRDAESFLERSGRVAGYGAWQIDLRTQAVTWNEQTCDIHGVDHDFKPTLEQALAYYPPDARAQVQAAIKNAVESMQCWDMTLPFVDAYGNALWVRTVGEVEFDDSGPVRLLGALQDVTQATLAQLAHAKTADMLQLVLDSAVDVAVIATDLQQSITLFNAGAERLLGYTAAELVGKRNSSVFFDPTQLAVVGESLALVLGRTPTGQEIFDDVVTNAPHSEWTFVRKDGSTTVVSLAISPMRDGFGAIVGYLGLAHDISQQQQYEASLRKAMQAAEQASVAKSQFLANMSHEIRTPMNAILGMLSLLGNTALSERQRDYTDKTEGAARDLLGLLNDVLDFSKVEAGKMELNLEPFAVETLLGDLSVILSANLNGKAVDLVFDIDPAIPPTLVGDAMRLKQVLINLGGNAVKFTAQGEVLIQWRLLEQAQDQATIEIAVRDTGIGIAPENQAKIFEGFSQAESSTTRRFGGTGLGLGISQRLVALMGGSLALSSELGQGSTFRFTIRLPVHPGAIPTNPPDAALPQRPLRVLLVDDNATGLQAGAVMMRSLGWEVVCASSGEQALDVIGQERLHEGSVPLDMVLVDWQMPGMDGWETLRNIRRLYGDAAPPRMVILSGQGREQLAQRSVREQELLNGFLVKPLTATMLRRVATASTTPSDALAQPGPAVGRRQRLQGMRILVVEDNPINQQVARELLSAQGAQVTLADNGRIGVDTVAAADPPFDVVLMDLQMPVMGGLDAARAIRQGLGLHTLPVIAMTANAMASDRQDCLEAGMNDHIGKPFNLTHLVEKLVHYTHWPVDVSEDTPTAPAPAPTLADTAPWPPEMDVAGALERMGGDAGLLLDTLRAFAASVGQIADQVDQRIAAGDLASAQREMHTFKGLAATVGLNALSKLAAAAELALRNQAPQSELKEQLQQLRAQALATTPILDTVSARLQALRHPAAHGAGAETAAAGNPDDLYTQLETLHQALLDDDMGAMELHAVLLQDFEAVLGDAAQALNAAMAELEFTQAAAECETLLDRLRQ